jgi:hypothetical protein
MVYGIVEISIMARAQPTATGIPDTWIWRRPEAIDRPDLPITIIRIKPFNRSGENPMPDFAAPDAAILAQTGRAENAADGLDAVDIWTAHSTETVYPLDGPSGHGNTRPCQLRAGRGEAASVQIALRARAELGDAQVALDEFIGPRRKSLGKDTASVRLLRWVNRFRDALTPVDKIQLIPGENIVLWVTVETPRDAKPGTYKGALRIKTAQGEKAVPIRLTVWDLTLPLTPSIPAVFGISDKMFSERYGLKEGTPEWGAALDQWYQALIKFRISPYFARWIWEEKSYIKHHAYCSPWPMEDPRTAAYLADPRLARFAIPFFTIDDATFKKNAALLKSMNLLDHGYLYVADEPVKEGAYAQVREWAAKIRAVDTGLKPLITYYRGPDFGPHDNDVSAVPKLLPDVALCAMGEWSAKGKEKNVDKARGALGPGQELWTYTCCGPAEPMPNLLARMSGISHRAVMWRVWKERWEGFLYWAANEIFKAEKPGDQIVYRPDLPEGDGAILYPGEAFGAKGPVASVRLERFRESMQDYEYLKMYAEKAGMEKALEVLGGIYQGPVDYTDSAAAIEEFRADATKDL